MTETRTLQFESPRAVQSLYANDLKLLKTLEDSLGVKVTTRDGWVKLEGEAEPVNRAQRVFEQLEVSRPSIVVEDGLLIEVVDHTAKTSLTF